MGRTCILLPHVWDQVGALSEVSADFNGVCLYCYNGSITAIINGTSFEIKAGEALDEGVINGETFEVTGTGVWKGFLRGIIS
jgi:hypothetical protein